MTGRWAWNREQQARLARAGDGVLRMLFVADADRASVMRAQLYEAGAAPWTLLTAFVRRRFARSRR